METGIRAGRRAMESRSEEYNWTDAIVAVVFCITYLTAYHLVIRPLLWLASRSAMTRTVFQDYKH